VELTPPIPTEPLVGVIGCYALPRKVQHLVLDMPLAHIGPSGRIRLGSNGIDAFSFGDSP